MWFYHNDIYVFQKNKNKIMQNQQALHNGVVDADKTLCALQKAFLCNF